MAKAYVFTRYGGSDTESLIDLPVPVPGPANSCLPSTQRASIPPTGNSVRGICAKPSHCGSRQYLGSRVRESSNKSGTTVTGFAVGDEVFGRTLGTGSYSEYTLVPAVEAAHKPSNVFLSTGRTDIAAGRSTV